jgi:hypothetical protein
LDGLYFEKLVELALAFFKVLRTAAVSAATPLMLTQKQMQPRSNEISARCCRFCRNTADADAKANAAPLE